MPWFRCLALGENFVLGDGQVLGFFTTRWVEAESPEQAEYAALSLLRLDEGLKTVVNKEASPNAKVTFEEIVEVENGDRAPGKGFTWFPMEKEESVG